MKEIVTTFQPKGQKVEKSSSGEIHIEGDAQPVDKPQKTKFKNTGYSIFPKYSLAHARLIRHFR